METMKQELAIEYQRINDKHKYNLELQQKLEQLSEFTSSEQRKLEEQRAIFSEEKRKFTEELSTRFKALQEEYTRQKEDLQRQEEQRVATAEEQALATRQAKEVKKLLKAQQKEDADRIHKEAEAAREAELNSLRDNLRETQTSNDQLLAEKNREIQALLESSTAEYEALSERVKYLERQLKTSEYNASVEVLSYFSSVVSTLAGGIHAVSLERANNTGENGEACEDGEPLKDLKRTFFRTINEQFVNKLKELDE